MAYLGDSPPPNDTFPMKKLACLFWTSSPLLLFLNGAQAWSGAGHQVIAAEAYRQLAPALQKKVTQVLQAHPAYEKWKGSFISESPALDLATFIFIRSSTWADEIRRRDDAFNHPKWHYVDYPLRPPRFAVEPGPSPENDILYGISQCERALSARKTSAPDRAVYLAWLIHLAGDIHMPLHCSSFFNDAYPKGDRGGNSYYIKPAVRGISLHSFWDGLLGTSGGPQAHLNYAIQLEQQYPEKSLKELRKARTPKKWSLESRGIAVEKAYLRGQLKGGTDRENGIDLPEGYTKAAKIVAEKQAAFAGYRLAEEIRKWLR